MVWPHLKILWHGEDSSAGDSEKNKKERKTEEETTRQHQGMESGDSLWQRKPGKGGKALLQRHLWCPDDLRG